MRVWCWVGVLIMAGCGSRPGPPYDPDDAIETFRLREGFEIELWAAEPDVIDPVAMEFDADGRVYVVENSGYPLNVDGRVGKIKLLDAGRTTTFAEGLRMPTGVLAWKRGILVTDAPDVLYFEDTDGDGRSDVRKVILTGFAFTNPQHTVSSPIYGLDNWIYLSHEGFTRAVVFSKEFGDTGTEIRYPDSADAPRVPVERRSVRFKPDEYKLELTAGPSQFGMTFDEWGAVFTHNNSNHARHEVIAARYLERNPALRLGQPWHDMFGEGNPAKVYPVTQNARYELLTDVGQMTSAGGLTRYLGGAFPGFEDTAFVTECAHNLVHADRWAHAGSTFTARRLEPGDKEFLASTDAWFRPVNLYIGPEGALYVVDYYREMVEHPEWTSAEMYKSDVLYEGNEAGRIWRITPNGGLKYEQPRLSAASAVELVRELDSPNIWRRRTAQRLLVERRDPAALDPLRELAVNGSALGRVHALWTLEGLGAMDAALVAKALADPEGGVRKNAIQLAEPRLKEAPALVARLFEMEKDPDPHVRLQLLLTLGEINSPAAVSLRDSLLFASVNDEWVQVAALSWPGAQAERLYAEAVKRLGGEPTAGRRAFLRRLAAMAAAEGKAGDVLAVVRADRSEWRREAGLEGLVDGLSTSQARQAVGERERAVLFALAETSEAALRALEEVGAGSGPAAREALTRAAPAAGNKQADPSQRVVALRILALGSPAAHAGLLKGILNDPSEPETVQQAAVRAYGLIDSEEVGPYLLERLRQFAGGARSEAVDALLRNEDRLAMLLDAIERGEVQPWMLAARQQRRYIMHPNPDVRARGRKLISEPSGDRQATLDQYKAALAMAGNTERGRAVFERACQKCHRVGGAGEEVGPDLGTIAGRLPVEILSDILLPNRSITQTYESYVVETKDGRILDGVIGPQGPGFVTLRREGGEEDRIPRSEIKEMRAAQLSAMPEDMEKQVSVEEMADLISFLKSSP